MSARHFNPDRDPIDHLLDTHSWMTKEFKRLLRIAQ